MLAFSRTLAPRTLFTGKDSNTMPLAPIWKDRLVTLASSGDYADFEIRRNTAAGELLYRGRAYPRPGQTEIVARINDICAAHLGAPLPDFGNRYTPMQVSDTFVTLAQPGAVVKDTITFVNDWSYDPARVHTAGGHLSAPITGELDPRQTLFFSVLSGAQSVNVTLRFADNTTAVVSVPVAFSADFNDDFNGDFAQQDDASKSGTAILDLSAFTDLAAVSFLGLTLPVRAQGCARYCAAYVNAYGGWDTFILDGEPSLRDGLTRHTASYDYDNADGSARGRKDYAIEVTPAWTLRTGILTDDESLRMHHLLNSTEVYLQDLADGTFYPVVLTDTENARRTYKGNGRQLNTYAFNAELAQDRYRR